MKIFILLSHGSNFTINFLPLIMMTKINFKIIYIIITILQLFHQLPLDKELPKLPHSYLSRATLIQSTSLQFPQRKNQISQLKQSSTSNLTYVKFLNSIPSYRKMPTRRRTFLNTLNRLSGTARLQLPAILRLPTKLIRT